VLEYWSGPFDSTYLTDAMPGEQYDCLEHGQEACIKTVGCAGLTGAPKSVGKFVWQLRIGRRVRMGHSETGEISYTWTLRNYSHGTRSTAHRAAQYGVHVATWSSERMHMDSRSWHGNSGNQDNENDSSVHFASIRES